MPSISTNYSWYPFSPITISTYCNDPQKTRLLKGHTLNNFPLYTQHNFVGKAFIFETKKEKSKFPTLRLSLKQSNHQQPSRETDLSACEKSSIMRQTFLDTICTTKLGMRSFVALSKDPIHHHILNEISDPMANTSLQTMPHPGGPRQYKSHVWVLSQWTF